MRGTALLTCALLLGCAASSASAEPPGAQPAAPAAAPRADEGAASGSQPSATKPPSKEKAKPKTAPKPQTAKPAAEPAAQPQPQGGAAAAPDANALLAQVQARYESVVDLRASFEQRSRVASLGRHDSASGTLAVRRPGRMRWEYSAPEAHVLTLDGKTLRMYVPAEKQLQIAALDASSFSPTALSFLLGDGNLVEDFNAEGLPPRDDGALGLRLRPKQDSGFEYLELWLAPGALTLRESVVMDLFGNRTAVHFDDVVENAGVPEDIFEIQVPSGTQVIDLR